jgi:hypothetical protein
MPGNGGSDAPFFRERLYVPLRWWVIATLGVAVGGAEVFAGFHWKVALIVYAVLGVPTAALLLATGHVTVTVDAAGLHARGATLPVDQMLEMQRLDHDKTKHQLGPGGDRTAHLVARGYVRESVAIRTTEDSGVPYWLVSSRKPEDLIAALTAAGLRPGGQRTPTSQSTPPNGHEPPL